MVLFLSKPNPSWQQFSSKGNRMRSSSERINIAACTRRLNVDNRFPLRYYYRIADNILKQVTLPLEFRFFFFFLFSLFIYFKFCTPSQNWDCFDERLISEGSWLNIIFCAEFSWEMEQGCLNYYIFGTVLS